MEFGFCFRLFSAQTEHYCNSNITLACNWHRYIDQPSSVWLSIICFVTLFDHVRITEYLPTKMAGRNSQQALTTESTVSSGL